ncbi:MAG: PilZ domain-containing protein [Candidatus Velthaea sp.]
MAETVPEKRGPGAVRLRKFIDVVVEDRLSFTLFRCAIADISPTGMRIIADQYLPKGTKYTFTMKRAPFLTLRGEVRWVRPKDRDTFQVGVLFVDVSAEDARRLTMFLDLERQRVPLTTNDA